MAPLAPRRPEAVAPTSAVAAAHARGQERGLRRHAARAGGPADARPGDQPRRWPTRWPPTRRCWSSARTWRRKGGVYGVTRGLQKRFGAGAGVRHAPRRAGRSSGLALGAGVSGLLPVPEIQYLAYLHNALDQIRGEAATLSFFSQGAYRNPMVVRVAGLRLPEGLRRPLPQRQLRRRAARHPRPGRRLARPARRRRRDAAHLPGRRPHRRQRLRVPRADRALPHARPVRGRATAAGSRRTRRRRAGRRRTCRSAAPAATATAAT